MTGKTTYRAAGTLEVAEVLHDFIEKEALPSTGLSAEEFWTGLADIIRELGPRNKDLLATRDRLQGQIDSYHRGGGVVVVEREAGTDTNLENLAAYLTRRLSGRPSSLDHDRSTNRIVDWRPAGIGCFNDVPFQINAHGPDAPRI